MAPYLCWNYSTRAGCTADADKCTKGKHELIKLKGLRPLINTHLIRIGGHRTNKKSAIEDIDMHVQALRQQLTASDLSKRVKTDPKGAAG